MAARAVLYVMVGLNSIDKDPKSFTDLQRLWEACA